MCRESGGRGAVASDSLGNVARSRAPPLAGVCVSDTRGVPRGRGPRRCVGACRAGETGREWCYVEAQLLSGAQTFGKSAWNYCSPVTDYDTVRAASASAFAAKVSASRAWVARLQKAQRAGEKALEKLEQACK